MNLFYIFLFGVAVSWGCAHVMVMLYRSLKISDKSLQNKQTVHTSPTPRLGGVAIICSVVVVNFFFLGKFETGLFLAIIPLFFVGLVEDLKTQISPKIRLGIGVFSSLIVISYSGVWLSAVDMPGLDYLLSFSAIGIIFTIMAIVGMINAVNIIDGVNGLASGKATISAIALGIVAFNVGEITVAYLAMFVAAASFGLFLVNYPKGTIFMGDAGAYTIGLILAWIIVLIKVRNPEVSGWALLAIIFWPVMDTLYSIVRRTHAGKRSDKPDLMHFHQLVMRFWEIISDNKISRQKANPMATATILPLAAVPVIFGVVFSQNNLIAFLIVIMSCTGFVFAYTALVKLTKSKRKRKIAAHYISRFLSSRILKGKASTPAE